MKRTITILLIAGLCAGLSISTAWAGKSQPSNRSDNHGHRYDRHSNGVNKHNKRHHKRKHWDNSAQRYRWEGVAIGLGAALLGHALANQSHPPHAVRPIPAPANPAHRYRYDKRGYRPQRTHGGHWTVQKRWIPAKRMRVWNPGHYDKRAHWVPAGWIWVEKRPGRWKKERVWVSYR